MYMLYFHVPETHLDEVKMQFLRQGLVMLIIITIVPGKL